MRVLNTKFLALHILYDNGVWVPTLEVHRIMNEVEKITMTSVYTALYSLEKLGYASSKLKRSHLTGKKYWKYWKIREAGVHAAIQNLDVVSSAFLCNGCNSKLINICISCGAHVCCGCYSSIDACKICVVNAARSEHDT